MAGLGKVFGIDKVLQGLAKAGKKHREIEFTSVIVGYTASYASHVHENTEVNKAARAKKGQKAKFLEDPTRQLANSGELGSIVTGVVRSGASIITGLNTAGLRILRESQLEVPVDTSHLKGSGTVRKDRI